VSYTDYSINEEESHTLIIQLVDIVITSSQPNIYIKMTHLSSMELYNILTDN